ncbi:MAG: hypothetical protein AB1397_02990 [bacterium]
MKTRKMEVVGWIRKVEKKDVHQDERYCYRAGDWGIWDEKQEKWIEEYKIFCTLRTAKRINDAPIGSIIRFKGQAVGGQGKEFKGLFKGEKTEKCLFSEELKNLIITRTLRFCRLGDYGLRWFEGECPFVGINVKAR